MTNSGDGCCAPGGDHVAGDHDVESSAPRETCGACGCNHPQHGYLGHKDMHLRRPKGRCAAWSGWLMRRSTALIF